MAKTSLSPKQLLLRLESIDLSTLDKEEQFLLKNHIASLKYIDNNNLKPTQKLLDGFNLLCELYGV